MNKEQSQTCQEEVEFMRIEEKVAWIWQYGSERLRLLGLLSYENDHIYAVERASIDYPEFSLMRNDNFIWAFAESPSLKALRVVQEVGERMGVNASVVSVLMSSSGNREEQVIKFEAVIIPIYMQAYSLIRLI
jgi:hypothetical protein